MPDPAAAPGLSTAILCHVPATPSVSSLPPDRWNCRRRSCCWLNALIKARIRCKAASGAGVVLLALRPSCSSPPRAPWALTNHYAGVAVLQPQNNAKRRRLSTLPPWRPLFAGGPRAGGRSPSSPLAAAWPAVAVDGKRRACAPWYSVAGPMARPWNPALHRHGRSAQNARSFSGSQPVGPVWLLPQATCFSSVLRGAGAGFAR